MRPDAAHRGGMGRDGGAIAGDSEVSGVNQPKLPHIFGNLSIVFLKKSKIFMIGKKKAKCYKKIEVKVWFRRLGNADKYWLESFRDYTK